MRGPNRDRQRARLDSAWVVRAAVPVSGCPCRLLVQLLLLRSVESLLLHYGGVVVLVVSVVGCRGDRRRHPRHAVCFKCFIIIIIM